MWIRTAGQFATCCFHVTAMEVCAFPQPGLQNSVVGMVGCTDLVTHIRRPKLAARPELHSHVESSENPAKTQLGRLKPAIMLSFENLLGFSELIQLSPRSYGN